MLIAAFALVPRFVAAVFAFVLTSGVLAAVGTAATRRRRATGATWAVGGGDEVFADAPAGEIGSATRPATPDDARAPVAVRFTPPDGLAPEDCSALVEGRTAGTDVAAVVVQLVVTGHQRIRRGQGRRPLIGAAPRTWVLTGRVPDAAVRLTRAQEQLREVLPAPGAEATLVELRPRIAPVVARVRKELVTPAHLSQWLRSTPLPPLARAALALGAAVCFVTLPGLLASLAGDGDVAAGIVTTAGPSVAAGALAGLLLALLVAWPARRHRTALGSAQVYALQGFREYLRTAEGPSLRLDEAAAQFSRYLPWAVALGVTTEWTRAFQQAAARADADTLVAWGPDLSWNGDLALPDVGGVPDGAVDLGGVADPGSWQDLGGLGDLGASFDAFADSLSDLASDMGDLAGDLGSDIGGGDSGGGDSGGGDSGGGDSGGGSSD